VTVSKTLRSLGAVESARIALSRAPASVEPSKLDVFAAVAPSGLAAQPSPSEFLALVTDAANARQPSAKLLTQATQFIRDNAGGEHGGVGEGKLFPAIDSGEDGLHGYAATGDSAERLLAVGEAMRPEDFDAFDYDPAQHLIVAVRTTNDEEVLFLAALDRKTGEGTFLSEIEMVDFAEILDQQTFDAILPDAGPMDELDHYDLIDLLVDGSAELALNAE
jgi:hypothetical protein